MCRSPGVSGKIRLLWDFPLPSYMYGLLKALSSSAIRVKYSLCPLRIAMSRGHLVAAAYQKYVSLAFRATNSACVILIVLGSS